MDETLRKLDGLQTLETVMNILNIKKQTALNLISKLKKAGYVQTKGGGKRVRLYKISQKKFRKRDVGMFDLINKYSPHMKIAEWYDHQVHGTYKVEDAIVDAIKTESFRVIIASLHLYKHIKNWTYLRRAAVKKDSWQQVLAMHAVARLFFKVTSLPKSLRAVKFKKTKYLINKYKTKETLFQDITKRLKVEIPFNRMDLNKW